jgi:hypothetical protein
MGRERLGISSHYSIIITILYDVYYVNVHSSVQLISFLHNTTRYENDSLITKSYFSLDQIWHLEVKNQEMVDELEATRGRFNRLQSEAQSLRLLNNQLQAQIESSKTARLAISSRPQEDQFIAKAQRKAPTALRHRGSSTDSINTSDFMTQTEKESKVSVATSTVKPIDLVENSEQENIDSLEAQVKSLIDQNMELQKMLVDAQNTIDQLNQEIVHALPVK